MGLEEPMGLEEWFDTWDDDLVDEEGNMKHSDSVCYENIWKLSRKINPTIQVIPETGSNLDLD